MRFQPLLHATEKPVDETASTRSRRCRHLRQAAGSAIIGGATEHCRAHGCAPTAGRM